MKKLKKNKHKNIGEPPGTLVYIGDKKNEEVTISIIDYDEQQYQEKIIKNIDECLDFKDKTTVTWINIDGIHNVEIIEKIGKCFNLHPLLLEDILNTNQRPKIEDFEDYLSIVLKILYHDDKDNKIKSEQFSLVIGSNFVITFQENKSDIFNTFKDRIRNGKGRIRKMKTDYLGYAIIDTIVDNYFITLEKIGEKIEGVEEEIMNDPTPNTLRTIHNQKRDMILLRKSIWPLREIINNIQKSDSSLIQDSTDIYLRDLYDHTIQIIDTIESFRDILSGLVDLYLSVFSNKMNEIMKVLTIIATIFIPLTFIAGLYGMNFNPEESPFNMPELNLYFGYPTALLSMIIVAFVMVIYFKRKNWL